MEFLHLETIMGNIVSYPITLAGIYKLSQELNNVDFNIDHSQNHKRRIVQDRIYCLSLLISWAENALGSCKQKHEIIKCANNIMATLDCWAVYDYYYFDNLELHLSSRHYVRPFEYTGGYYLPLDMCVNIRGCFFLKEDRKSICYDKEYNEVFLDIENLDDTLVYPDEICGAKGKCHDHLIDDGYERCCCCGQYFKVDEMRVPENDDCEYVCNHCIRRNSRFRECYECGALIDTQRDFDGGITSNDVFYCCDSCASDNGYDYRDSDGYYIDYDPDDYDESYDEDDNESYEEQFREYIHDYHTSKSEFSDDDIFVGSLKKNQNHLLACAPEIETEGRLSVELFELIDKELGKFGYSCEHDGSLGWGGFELVLLKMTQDAFKKDVFPHIKNVLDYMRKNGRTSHDGGRCGLHWHFSRYYFGDTREKQDDSAKKVASFLNYFKDEFRKISRRSSDGYAEYWGSNVITKNTYLSKDRYHALNVATNIPTFEFRLFRGTLDANSFLASHDICYCLAKNAKRIAWKDVHNPKKWFDGLSKVAKDYIIGRGVFEDVFMEAIQ